MTKIAIVGFGFMGRTHYGAWKKCRNAKVVAVCDSNLAQLSAKVVGNIAGAADNTALPKDIKIYADFDEMLSAGGFDAVDITLPTPLHRKTTEAALNAGFHVLCEKPMALSLADCNAMLEAAKKSKRVLLVAQCVRFFPEYAWLANTIRSKRFGRVIAADFTRFMAAPQWSPKGGSWLLDESKSGGLYVDAHIHDSDYIASVFGMPASVRSVAHRSAHGYVDHTTTLYSYPDGKIVTSDSSFAASQSLVWDASARIILEGATIFMGGKYQQPVTVYPNRGKPYAPKIGKLSGYEEEVRYFLSMIASKKRKDEILTAKDARDSIALVLAERKSAQTGREIKL